MSGPLVLSLFPGIGLLDMAFELEGFCVVRGPDLLWGGDVRRFHPPACHFDGVIGGPPCKAFSPLANVNRARYGEGSIAANLIPEFERIVDEARPEWFVMENVRRAPLPDIAGYVIQDRLLNNRWLGEEQNRLRRFSFGVMIEVDVDAAARFMPQEAALEAVNFEAAVRASVGGRRHSANPTGIGKRKRTHEGEPSDIAKSRPMSRNAELQGLPANFDIPPFSRAALKEAIGNGVPLPMGRAVAKAVKRALGIEAAPLGEAQSTHPNSVRG